MAEYIERAETAEFFEKSKQTMWHKDDIAATISSKKNIHSADVVEVVRCKDCIQWDDKEKDCCVFYNRREYDYCSYGERLEADGDKNG